MEIERKWLVRPDRIPYKLSDLKSYSIEQGYVSFYPTIRFRRINGGEENILTVKTCPAGSDHNDLEREEYEFPISDEEYESLRKNAKGNLIFKTRYLMPLGNGLTEEIDIFSGDLEGLAYLEIEFGDAETAQDYPSPDWVEKDVTYDKRYKNTSLAKHGIPE